LRAEHFDAIHPGAAERLAALDVRRAEWDARVSAFQTARAELELRLLSSPDELDLELTELRDATFTSAEQRRLNALNEL
jgi:lipase chaperone LimK